MAFFDWCIVAIYLLITIGIGLFFYKKANRSTDDYFVAGRSLGWFLAGTSIVATTFSSDTPLVVSGISRSTGIFGHWFWLSAAIGQTATIFFFARYWRRTEAKTDLEFISLRYERSRATSALRIFKVIYDGVILNCIVMASVTLAMAKVLKILLNLNEDIVFSLPFGINIDWTTLILFVLGAVATFYSTISGLYGVVYTDLVQFVFAMAGSIGLAVIVYLKASSGKGIFAKLAESNSFNNEMLSFLPPLKGSLLSVFTVIVYMAMIWWYRVPGNGYYVQRLLATRTEKDSILAFLWFNICQYIIRPWPWIIVGLLSLYYFPEMEDPENSFPEMISFFLPAGLKGIMVASMLAAFMSTLDTHMNWGTSYIINDLYKPFIRKDCTEKHCLFITKFIMVFMILTTLAISTKLTSILGAYKYLSIVYGGTGTVMIMRWYWWKVNPWSEISAIITSVVVANLLHFTLNLSGRDLFALKLVITIFTVTIVWTITTIITSSKTPSSHIVNFYSKMRLPGSGWNKVQQIAGVSAEPNESLRNFLGWISCITFIFSATIGLGKLLLHSFVIAAACFILSGISGIFLYRNLSKTGLFSESKNLKE